MVALVLCEGDIMISIWFTIDDDFAGGVRCDNWVGSLFGEGGRVELANPPFFTLLGHNIDHLQLFVPGALFQQNPYWTISFFCPSIILDSLWDSSYDNEAVMMKIVGIIIIMVLIVVLFGTSIVSMRTKNVGLWLFDNYLFPWLLDVFIDPQSNSNSFVNLVSLVGKWQWGEWLGDSLFWGWEGGWEEPSFCLTYHEMRYSIWF